MNDLSDSEWNQCCQRCSNACGAGGADVAAKTHPPPPSSLSISRLKTIPRPSSPAGTAAAECPEVAEPPAWEAPAAQISQRAPPPQARRRAADDSLCGTKGRRAISVSCLFQPGSGGNQRDHPELSLGLLESPFSMFHNMGLCSRPGVPGNISGPSYALSARVTEGVPINKTLSSHVSIFICHLFICIYLYVCMYRVDPGHRNHFF